MKTLGGHVSRDAHGLRIRIGARRNWRGALLVGIALLALALPAMAQTAGLPPLMSSAAAPGPAIPTIPPVPTTAPRPLTLADAISAGLQNNFQIRQAGLQVAIARTQLREAEAQKAVTLGGAANYTYNSLSGGAPLAGTITIPSANVVNQPFVINPTNGLGPLQNQWVFGLTLKYPLYSGGALEAQVRTAQANLTLAEAQFTQVAEQVVFTVRQAYSQTQATQASADAAQRSVDAAQENVRVTQARVQAGTSPQFDLLQAQVQLAQSQLALTSARTTAAQAQLILATVLVAPLSTTVTTVIPPGLPEVPQDVNALIQQALQNRPELAQVLAAEQAAQGAIDLAAAGLKPNIILSGGPQILTTDPTNRDPVNWTATIAVTIAILDGGLTQSKVDEARQRLQSAKVSEEQTRQQVEFDVRIAYLALGNAAESLRSALVGQTSTREALRVANVRFGAGVGTQLDVVTAVQNAATADNNVIQAQFNYTVAVAQLDRAIGVQVKF